MGRIFISAGHGGRENGMIDQGSLAAGTTEAREMILTRDVILPELRSRGLEVLSVPDDLSQQQTIEWINARARSGDIALEIHSDAFSTPTVRGTTVYYIANNDQRRKDAETVLLGLLRRVPQLTNRGAKPDTATGVGSLSFCRLTVLPALQMEIGFLSNPDDRFLIQNRRREIALGIADGLASWVRSIDPTTPVPQEAYLPCNININGQNYPEQGIIINGNAFIPVDLADRLSIDISKDQAIRRISYRSVVYVKAIDLRNYNISIGWDSGSRTVLLRSIFQICPGDLDRLYKVRGKTSEVQMMMFLKNNNEAALAQFPEIAKLYKEEGDIEGINYDIAFSQMCVETSFLRFGSDIKSTQNNFAGLGAIGGSSEGAAFPSARIGIRAQIQHLKAYATTEPLVQEVVDPRFNFVARGVAPLIDLLTGRWNADPSYGDKILAMLKRLYEASGLM